MNYLSSLTKGSSCSASNTPELPPTIARTPSPSFPTNGYVGKGRLARDFRVLFVNGCSYEEWEIQAAAQKISSLFQKTMGQAIKVHYTYIPMDYSKVLDILRRGKSLPGVEALVTSIRDRLKDLSKPAKPENDPQNAKKATLGSGGRLAIILHSGGAAFFKAAMEKLTEKERKKIDVIGLGAACLFDKKNFHNAMNVIAYGDPFPKLAQIASGTWFKRSSPEVVPAGNRWQTPVLSHKFFNTPYQETLAKIIATYAKEASSATATASPMIV